MTETRNFNAPNLQLNSLVDELSDWFRSQSFNVQALDVHEGGTLVQVSKGGWRNFVGMSSALNVVLRQSGTELTVEIGAGKWIDKIGAGAVSMLVLWPLAVTAAWGAWRQSQLPKQTFEFIQKFVSIRGSNEDVHVAVTQPVKPVATTSVRFCPSCGASITENARFCSNCGYSLN